MSKKKTQIKHQVSNIAPDDIYQNSTNRIKPVVYCRVDNNKILRVLLDTGAESNNYIAPEIVAEIKKDEVLSFDN